MDVYFKYVDVIIKMYETLNKTADGQILLIFLAKH